MSKAAQISIFDRPSLGLCVKCIKREATLTSPSGSIYCKQCGQCGRKDYKGKRSCFVTVEFFVKHPHFEAYVCPCVLSYEMETYMKRGKLLRPEIKSLAAFYQCKVVYEYRQVFIDFGDKRQEIAPWPECKEWAPNKWRHTFESVSGIKTTDLWTRDKESNLS